MLLPLLLLIALALAPAAGAAEPPWEAAEEVRASLFESQTGLLLDEPATGSLTAAGRSLERSLAPELERADPAALGAARAALRRAGGALASGDEVALANARGQVAGRAAPRRIRGHARGGGAGRCGPRPPLAPRARLPRGHPLHATGNRRDRRDRLARRGRDLPGRRRDTGEEGPPRRLPGSPRRLSRRGRARGRERIRAGARRVRGPGPRLLADHRRRVRRAARLRRGGAGRPLLHTAGARPPGRQRLRVLGGRNGGPRAPRRLHGRPVHARRAGAPGRPAHHVPRPGAGGVGPRHRGRATDGALRDAGDAGVRGRSAGGARRSRAGTGRARSCGRDQRRGRAGRPARDRHGG